MSCNIKRIKGCEIAGSTFNGRKLSLNRDLSNDTFKAKVKTFNQKPIAEITGVKNATDVYFPFNGLENLSAGLYIIEYWGNFEDIGNELFCIEEFSVVAPSKAGEAQCCDNYNVFNFVTEDVSIDIQIETTVINIGGGGDLSNYYTKDETYSKTEVDDIIADIPVVDTSNLVPYIGANKDVNIASNYFKTSKGFDFTKDEYNYFTSYYDGESCILDFISKDDMGFGSINVRVNPENFYILKTNNVGLTSNYFTVTNEETFSLKPFVSDSGFKTTTGTENQALRADGGVFDLNTKADLVGGKVPSSQLPSYVDDVLEFANLASFPATGESGKIYIAIDTNITYRWSGTGYAEISASLALGETASTAYRGDRGKIAYDHSQTTGNPHGTTAAQVGASPIGHTHSGEIITPNAITIAGSYTDLQAETLAIGTIFYNSDQQCYMQKLSVDVYHNFGAELPSLSKIGDNTNHLNGMPVYISSGAGNLKIVSLTNSTIGKAEAMATQDVANNGNKTGYYCYFGGVNKFPRANVIKSTDDPATWIEGAELRLCNENGKLSTQIEPAPAKCPVVARITAVNGANISVNFTPNKSFTVEDASNIDGDTTSIEDTDIILKKEVGGLWRKINWANIKATLKTYFDGLYAPKPFNVKVTTPSSWVTGTVSETEVLRIEIPPNSLSASDVLKLVFVHLSKINANAVFQFKGKLSESPTMPSGTTDQIFQWNNAPAGSKFLGLSRNYKIHDGQIWGFPFTENSATDITANINNTTSSKSYNRSVTNYLYVSIQLNNIADQVRFEGIQITNS